MLIDILAGGITKHLGKNQLRNKMLMRLEDATLPSSPFSTATYAHMFNYPPI
jgi:hypothetical protein